MGADEDGRIVFLSFYSCAQNIPDLIPRGGAVAREFLLHLVQRGGCVSQIEEVHHKVVS